MSVLATCIGNTVATRKGLKTLFILERTEQFCIQMVRRVADSGNALKTTLRAVKQLFLFLQHKMNTLVACWLSKNTYVWYKMTCNMCLPGLGGISSECSRQKLTQETHDVEQKINHE